MTAAEDDDPDWNQEHQATEGPTSAAEAPSRLQQAGAGLADAQAWKGQQIAMGWRKVVNALRRQSGED